MEAAKGAPLQHCQNSAFPNLFLTMSSPLYVQPVGLLVINILNFLLLKYLCNFIFSARFGFGKNSFLTGFGLGFLAFGLKKLLLPIFIGAQIIKSILIAMFLPSILGSVGKLVGKGEYFTAIFSYLYVYIKIETGTKNLKYVYKTTSKFF